MLPAAGLAAGHHFLCAAVGAPPTCCNAAPDEHGNDKFGARRLPHPPLLAPVLLQCCACCSELPPLPSETLADLQQKEAEMNADKNADEEVRVLALLYWRWCSRIV